MAKQISKGDSSTKSAMAQYSSTMMDCVKDVAAASQGTGAGWDITNGPGPRKPAKVSETSVETGARAAKPRMEADGEDWELDDDDEFEALHKARLAAMKKKHMDAQTFNAKGHGEYHEIVQDQFIKEITGSKNCVVHFYKKEFESCKVVDDRMRTVAKKVLSTKFVYIDAEKASFFVGKLGIKILPAIICFDDGKAIGRLDGLSELGREDFSAAMLAMKLAEKGGISIEAMSASEIEDL